MPVGIKPVSPHAIVSLQSSRLRLPDMLIQSSLHLVAILSAIPLALASFSYPALTAGVIYFGDGWDTIYFTGDAACFDGCAANIALGTSPTPQSFAYTFAAPSTTWEWWATSRLTLAQRPFASTERLPDATPSTSSTAMLNSAPTRPSCSSAKQASPTAFILSVSQMMTIQTMVANSVFSTLTTSSSVAASLSSRATLSYPSFSYFPSLALVRSTTYAQLRGPNLNATPQ